MEYFKILPIEIKLDILTRVPTDTVLECKLVCKPWRDLVRNSSFSKMHLHHLIHPANESGNLGFLASTRMKICYFEYNENYDELATSPIERIRWINLSPPFEKNASFVFNSCNGLICFSRTYPKGLNKHVCICNPITKEYVFLPQIKTDLDTDDPNWASGFGYVFSTNEYKVVVLVLNRKDNFGEIHIYTLGSSNGWRNFGKFESRMAYDFSPGVFANGVLYWTDVLGDLIVAFDLAEEKFCEDFELPPLPSEESYYVNIMVLDGFLSLAIDLGVQGAECFEYWQLKKKNDNDDKEERAENHALVWSKEFRIDDSTPLAVMKNNDVLTYSENYLNMYDTRTSTSKRLVDFEEKFCQVIIPYMKTLVSLKELGEKDTKIMESLEIQGEKALISLSTSCRRMRPWIYTHV